jgi:hypothetical protein
MKFDSILPMHLIVISPSKIAAWIKFCKVDRRWFALQLWTNHIAGNGGFTWWRIRYHENIFMIWEIFHECRSRPVHGTHEFPRRFLHRFAMAMESQEIWENFTKETRSSEDHPQEFRGEWFANEDGFCWFSDLYWAMWLTLMVNLDVRCLFRSHRIFQ